MLEVTKTLRHGDINFAPCAKTNKKVKKVKSLVVAEGETAGHFHKISTGTDTYLLTLDDDPTYFEVVGNNATIDHPEHGKVKLLPGIYKNWRERERDPFLSAIREVRD